MQRKCYVAQLCVRLDTQPSPAPLHVCIYEWRLYRVSGLLRGRKNPLSSGVLSILPCCWERCSFPACSHSPFWKEATLYSKSAKNIVAYKGSHVQGTRSLPSELHMSSQPTNQYQSSCRMTTYPASLHPPLSVPIPCPGSRPPDVPS